ncbi:MAG: hypothetical protein KF779_15580 [Hyphomonadaceae bacterium]|nr:hypothetical protein [Hyphomonadaceae bacterium]MCA8886203.1 hypothetical protein [Hyphomonadaceae bacterium]
MILRRIIEQVKAQNWTAVAIDFFIVVFGVFIGTQVSNWNDAQANQRRGAEFADQLRDDLRTEAWSYARLVEYNRDVLTAAQRAARALEGDEAISDEALLINAFVATQYINHQRSNATYEELTSTGAMGLIEDRSLRDLATLVYTTPVFADVVQEGSRSAYRERFRMILPNDVQNALAANCGDRFGARGDYQRIQDMIGYPCETGLAPGLIAEAARRIRNDQTLHLELRRRIADIQTRIADLTSNNTNIRDGLNALSEEVAQ